MVRESDNLHALPVKDDVAQRLADAHYILEEGISEIYRITSPNGEDGQYEPIKLLEVNRNTVPMGVVPVYFGPGRNIPYPSIIMDLTPEEFAELTNGKITLPNDWVLNKKPLPRPSDN